MSKCSLLPVRPRFFGLTTATLMVAAFLSAPAAHAQTFGTDFAAFYSFVSLGTPTGVPGPLGGLTLEAGNANSLLIGGSANSSSANVYQIGLVRSNVGGLNRITSFTGTASVFAGAAGGGGGGIDGGLAYAPNGTLMYTSYSDNFLGQIRSGFPNQLTSLSSFGIASSVGTLGFVPTGAPGAGRFKMASYNAGTFYDVTLSAPDANGFYSVLGATETASGLSGPEGFIYVPTSSPGFTNPSMLVSEYSAGRISAYEVDAQGNPIVASRRDFLTGLTGAEGAYLDAATGDFLFSTFGGGNQVISVRGLAAAQTAAPEPASLAMALPGLLGLSALAVRRRAKRQRDTSAV